jgi:hypothetical protein
MTTTTMAQPRELRQRSRWRAERLQVGAKQLLQQQQSSAQAQLLRTIGCAAMLTGLLKQPPIPVV